MVPRFGLASESLLRLSLNTVAADPTSLEVAEGGAWKTITGEWRQLFGSFAREGVSVEHHRFRTDRELDWGRSFHPDSLEICLNFQGSGRLRAVGQAEEAAVGVRSAAFYHVPRRAGGPRALVASRAPAEEHHFVTVELSREFLGQHLQGATGALLPSVGQLVESGAGPGAFAVAVPMSVPVQNTARALVDPPLTDAATPARRLWYGAKVLELVALLLFAPAVSPAVDAGELFCDRQKRLTRDRIEQARALLERDLENPPSLEMLASAVGCGAFHLSRAFSQHVGQTIPQYLRRVRLERAARLLREGRGNVSEVALAVGYQSLSHFSKAFWEQFGCCPGLYGNARLAEATRRVNRRRPTVRG